MPSLAGCLSHLRLMMSSTEKASLLSLICLHWKPSAISRVPTILLERPQFVACLHQYLDGLPTWLSISPYIKSNLLSLNFKGCLSPPPHHGPLRQPNFILYPLPIVCSLCCAFRFLSVCFSLQASIYCSALLVENYPCISLFQLSSFSTIFIQNFIL